MTKKKNPVGRNKNHSTENTRQLLGHHSADLGKEIKWDSEICIAHRLCECFTHLLWKGLWPFVTTPPGVKVLILTYRVSVSRRFSLQKWPEIANEVLLVFSDVNNIFMAGTSLTEYLVSAWLLPLLALPTRANIIPVHLFHLWRILLKMIFQIFNMFLKMLPRALLAPRTRVTGAPSCPRSFLSSLTHYNKH